MAVFLAEAVCEFVSCAKQAVAMNSAKRGVRNFFMRRNIISRAGKDNGIAIVAADVRRLNYYFRENKMEPPYVGCYEELLAQPQENFWRLDSRIDIITNPLIANESFP